LAASSVPDSEAIAGSDANKRSIVHEFYDPGPDITAFSHEITIPTHTSPQTPKSFSGGSLGEDSNLSFSNQCFLDERSALFALLCYVVLRNLVTKPLDQHTCWCGRFAFA
jgi:hypothetical protein